MKISSKSRYGLVAMVMLAKNYEEKKYVTLNYISEKLDISKIYLEQVFSLLKKANLVISAKGNQGGYQLSKSPCQISVLDIFLFIENSLFAETDKTVYESSINLENAINNLVYSKLDDTIKKTLSSVTLLDLVNEEQNVNGEHMYFL